jgi:hypothetical protein
VVVLIEVSEFGAERHARIEQGVGRNWLIAVGQMSGRNITTLRPPKSFP